MHCPVNKAARRIVDWSSNKQSVAAYTKYQHPLFLRLRLLRTALGNKLKFSQPVLCAGLCICGKRWESAAKAFPRNFGLHSLDVTACY
jgi:hypothetical protein